MSWLTTSQLLHLIKKYGDTATRRAFIGVFAIDDLPQHISCLPVLMIINTHTKNLPGEHWKAVFISKEGFAEVFDSLALPISSSLMNWLKRFSRKWITSHISIQHPLSATCGAYVLYFILQRLKHNSMNSLLKIFSSKLVLNDEKMIDFVYTLKH